MADEAKDNKKAAEEVRSEATEQPKKESAEKKSADDVVAEEKSEEKVKKQEWPELRAGYTVRLHIRVSEGKKDRIQIFEGMILAMSGKTPETKTITVRKVSKGYGVEKIIPLAMPSLEKIENVKKAKVSRSKLYYLRNYNKRLKEELVLENN